MSFIGISQLSTAAYSPADPVAGDPAGPAADGSTDPTDFAQRCTRAADDLAVSGRSADPGSARDAGHNLLGAASGDPSGGFGALAGLFGMLASLFGGNPCAAGGGSGAQGLATLPALAKTVAGFLA